MKCDGARELFSDYLEGSVDHALHSAFRSHLEQCSGCQREYVLFENTWSSLSVLPEIAPSRDFRHDVVMQAARLQHEKSKSARRHIFGIDFPAFIRRLEPARAVAASLIIAALVLFGPPVFHSYWGNLGTSTPAVGISAQQDSDVYYTTDLDSSPKTQWQSRKLQRNTLWVHVQPANDVDGRMVYRLRLSINQKALLAGETCGRIGAEVVLLPPGRYDDAARKEGTVVWSGSILSSSPVLVPAIFDSGTNGSSSLNLSVNWRFRGRDFSQIIFIPSMYHGIYSHKVRGFSIQDSEYVQNHAGLYSTLESISKDYGVPIVVGGQLGETSPAVAVGEGDLEWMMRSTLEPAELKWLAADNCVYVDKAYPTP